MICSSNGSICWIDCHGTYLDIFICNPATREVLLLPKSHPHDEDPSFGVGISYQCEEYSSRSGSWKRIGCVAHSPMSWKHVSINGTMNWFITSSEKEALYPSSILAVDMEENFRTIDLPKLKCSEKMAVSENGHVSSVAARNNEILFIVLNRYLVCNVRNGSWKEIWRRDVVAGCVPAAFAFTESLLPSAYGSQDSEPNLHVHSGLKYEKPSNIGFADRKTLMRKLGGGDTSLGESWLNRKVKGEIIPPSAPNPTGNP
ncbi:hypothetical protein AAG906_011808 [Vitis piasezkii]